MLPVIMAMYIVQEPDSLVVTIMSLIPILTPTMMVLRMNVIGVDAFNLADPMIIQALAGIVITILTIVLMIWLTGKIFRIGILMYGKRPTLPEIIKWIRHK